MKSRNYVRLSLLVLALVPGGFLQAQPVSFRIAGNFANIRQTLGGSTTAISDGFVEIHFTVTDPTEILTGPFFETVGQFAISSASVTVPGLGLSRVPLTDTNLDLFLFDDGSLEQFAFGKTIVSDPGNFVTASILLSESGSDFIEDPNRPLPLKSDLTGRQLSDSSSGFSNEFALNLAGGSTLELSPPVSNATIANEPSGPTGPGCALDASIVDGTLSLDFAFATSKPTVWSFWVSVSTKAIPIWSAPLPTADPPKTISLQVPHFPKIGTIGFLSTLVTADGIVCSDWKVVASGLPAEHISPLALRNLLRQHTPWR